jgi:hypothetical protein
VLSIRYCGEASAAPLLTSAVEFSLVRPMF